MFTKIGKFDILHAFVTNEQRTANRLYSLINYVLLKSLDESTQQNE